MKKAEAIQIVMMAAFLIALFTITDDILNKLYLDSVNKAILSEQPEKAETSE